MALADTDAEAVPLLSAAVNAPPLIEAPLPAGFGEKVTVPAVTGTLGSLALTDTASGVGKDLLVAVLWLLPPVGVRVKPWLSKAPRSVPPSLGRLMPRASAPGAPAAVPASKAGLPRSRAIVRTLPP